MDLFGRLCGTLYRMNKSWENASQLEKQMHACEGEYIGDFKGPTGILAEATFTSLKEYAKANPIGTAEQVIKIAKDIGMTPDQAVSFANGFQKTYK